jgi:hypothetical protein
MPGSDPADESPGVIAPLSQLGHGPTTDLKSADAINRDRTASRQRRSRRDQREAARLLVLLALALRVMLVSPSASARLHCQSRVFPIPISRKRSRR